MAWTKLTNGNCLEVLPKIEEASVDFVLCDLPHGSSNSDIPLDILWNEFHRVCKQNSVFCIFGTQPFTTTLISSNRNEFRYNWIWQKESPTGHFNVAFCPMKLTEDICIFSKCTIGHLSKNPIRYNPQKVYKDSEKTLTYPTNILKFSREKHQIIHTQKPVDLLECLVRTYTNEGDVVLDCCMGSGSSGVASMKSNRNFIGIEIDPNLFEVASRRIESTRKEFEIFFL